MKERSQIEFESRKRRTIRALIVFVALAVIVVVGLSLFGGGNSNTEYRKRYKAYNDGWTVIIDGERQMTDFPCYVESGEDDLIVIKKNLPATIDRYSAIAVRNYHMVMEVLIDGEVVYTYPDNWNESVTMISDVWSVINLGTSDYRKTLEIRYKNVSSPRFTGYLNDIYYGDDNSIIQHLREIGFRGFLSGIILIVIGIMLIVISWIYGKFSDQQANAPMGFVFFCFGVWLANRSKMPVLAGSNGRIFFLSVIAVLLVGPFFFLYSYYRNDIGKKTSIWGVRLSIGFAIFVLATNFIFKYNVQWLAAIAYFTSLIAILHQCFLLYNTAFGPQSKLRNKTELALDRIEFFFTAAFPIAGAIEMVVSKEELWTEISSVYRLAILAFVGMYLVTIIWRIYLVIKDRTLVSERLQESQLELMMGQIQPHFIFNTLSSIRTLVKVEPDVAYSMLYDFSNYLRANVDNVTNLDGIKFAAEVEHIKSYVNIEKVRFGNRLNVEYNIEVSDFVVPPLSIQPLVENAIKHGVCQKVEGGTVWLSSYEDDDYYIVEIDDDGVGFSKEAASRIFSVYEDNEDKVGMESNEVAILAMKKIMETLTLYDKDGNLIELEGPHKMKDLSGNGSEEHKSTGMMNIILRLRTISNAEMQIESTEGEGTSIKVMFPKG